MCVAFTDLQPDVFRLMCRHSGMVAGYETGFIPETCESKYCCGKWSAVCRYSYNIATNADERRENPSPAQQRINELLREQQMQKQFKK